MGRHPVQGQIVGRVDEDFVNGIDMDILGGHVFQIDLVNPGADLHVESHPRDGDFEAEGEMRIGLYGRVIGRGAGQASLPGAGRIDFPDPLLHLEKPAAARDAVRFERRGDSQADGLVGPGLVRHHQIRGQGVQTTLHALHGGVERLEVNGDIGPGFFHRESKDTDFPPFLIERSPEVMNKSP